MHSFEILLFPNHRENDMLIICKEEKKKEVEKNIQTNGT